MYRTEYKIKKTTKEMKIKQKKKHHQQQYLTMLSSLGLALCVLSAALYSEQNSSFRERERENEWMNEISFRLQKHHKEETELFTEQK